jgi:hypothetical protein
MSVLYDNTVRPRVDLLQRDKFPVIDIEQTPLELVKSLVDEGIGCKNRASALEKKLKGKTEEFWADFSRDTAGTRTKLTPAGSRAAARLMLHGYLSSLVLFHVRFGGNLPNRIRGEQYFLELVTPPRAQQGTGSCRESADLRKQLRQSLRPKIRSGATRYLDA